MASRTSLRSVAVNTSPQCAKWASPISVASGSKKVYCIFVVSFLFVLTLKNAREQHSVTVWGWRARWADAHLVGLLSLLWLAVFIQRGLRLPALRVGVDKTSRCSSIIL